MADDEDALSRQRDHVETMELILSVRSQGILRNDILSAFEAVPRRRFITVGSIKGSLSAHRSVPINCGQLQTAPVTTACMISALDPQRDYKILEIGTGSGYQTAILSNICRRIYTIDRFHTIISDADHRFSISGITNIVTRVADGLNGWPEQGSFDRIMVTAGLTAFPEALKAQMATNSVAVIPIIQDRDRCTIMKVTNTNGQLAFDPVGDGNFLPAITGVAARL